MQFAAGILVCSGGILIGTDAGVYHAAAGQDGGNAASVKFRIDSFAAVGDDQGAAKNIGVVRDAARQDIQPSV